MKVQVYSIISSMLLSMTTTVFAQKKLDEYQSTYFDKVFDINVSQDERDTSKYTYYIDCASADKLHKQVLLDIDSKKLPDFIEFLTSAKNTYSKWRETAKSNNVTELEKPIEVKRFMCAAAFVYGNWTFDFDVSIKPRAKIIKGNMMLIIDSDELQSSSNQFMKHDGLYLIFTTPNEVDDFIAKLDLNKARSFFSKKNKTEDLFKN